MGHRRAVLELKPRSIVVGRQRWDVGIVLGRPHVAEFLEAGLRESPGVGSVRANPVTGRLLVFHDTALSREEVGLLIRKEVVRAALQAMELTPSARPEPRVVPTAPMRHRHHTSPAFTVTGGAVAALVLGRSLRPPPLVRLGVVLLATVVVIRRAWRRSIRSKQASATSARPTRHPLLRIVGTHRWKFYLASLLSVLGQIMDMALALFIGWIALVLITGESAALVRLGLTSATSQLWFLTAIAAFVCIAVAVLSYIAGVLWRDLAQAVQHEWRTEMYAHIQRVELPYLEGERTTKIARVLTDDINQLGRFFATSANDLLQLGTSFLVLVPVFLLLAPGIAWIAFLPVPIIAWMSFYYQEHVTPYYATSGEDGSLLNSQLINNLEASATVKSFCAEDYEIDRIHRLSETYRQGNHRIDTRSTAYIQIVRVCATVSLAGILLLGGREVLAGTLSFEVFSPLVGLPQQVLWKLPGLGDAVDQYQRMMAALKRVLDLRDFPVESGENGRHLDAAKIEGELVLDQVSFAYPGRPPVVHDLSLRIAARKTTGIVGVTGAGKTTIAKLLLRFRDVDSGRVLLDGLDIRDMRLQDLRKAIGFVGQDAFLFDGTVGDNIRYGSFDADPQQLADAARLAAAEDFVQALPAQYDTMIGERGTTLSGGQKQRIAVARAILKSAPIVVLDEATSAVDNETESAMHHAVADFARDRTLVIIAHRLSTIRHADRIYVLGTGGVIVEGGTHDELLDRDGVYASLWRLQIGELGSDPVPG